MNAKRQITVVLVLVMSLLTLTCGAGKLLEPTITTVPTPTSLPTNTPLPTSTSLPTNTPLPTPTSLPTNTPLPTSDPKFLTLNATNDLLNLINTWNGKYVIFVNKDTDIKTLEDLNGKNIYCDMYTFGMGACFTDMVAFQTAAGVQMEIGLGNNIPQFFQQMAEDKNLVAFIPTTYADENSLQDNPDLKIVVFE